MTFVLVILPKTDRLIVANIAGAINRQIIRKDSISERWREMETEKFALYGFEIMIPTDWGVELNPKSTRKKGDVAFQSQKGNRVFVSWGSLDEAKRFKTLEEHRDGSLNQVKKGRDVKSLDVSGSSGKPRFADTGRWFLTYLLKSELG